jgi:hypothetical protein
MVAIVAILLKRGQNLQSSLLLLGMFALATVRLIPSTSRMNSSLAQLRYRYASTEVIYQELLALQQRPSEPLPGSAEEKVSAIPFRRALVDAICTTTLLAGSGISGMSRRPSM